MLTIASTRSGSTGVPKGVMIEHSALSTTILERAPRLGHRKDLRCILYSSYAFDSSVWEIFAPLLHGACLFIPTNEQRLAALPDYLNKKKIQMFASTPTIVQNILQSPFRVPHLATIDLGGEATTKSIIQEWSGKVRLINDYGPTEACIVACMNDSINPDTDPNDIGYAYGDATYLWVVEPTNHSRLAPVGCVGELLISGPTLARGYLNDPEKTAKVFIDCSSFAWIRERDERCYTTGDLVRRNGDGSLTYCGRKDLQIQLHGNRIEVGEIEHILALCDGVRLAAVESVLRDNSDVEMLVCFLTLDDNSIESSQETFVRPTETVRALVNSAFSKVSGALPKYMVPRLYLPIHAMPLSVGGKIDRKGLRKLYNSAPHEMLAAYRGHSASKRLPRTEIQKTLQGLWSQVLGIDKQGIGLDDDFAILGGDSLAAIKLASKATELGLGLSVADLLQASKFEDMAAAVRLDTPMASAAESKDPVPFSLLDDRAGVVASLYGQENVEDILPATSMQTTFVIRAQRWYRPYYFWFFIDVDQRLSPDTLHDACDAIVQRHQILRTAFHLIAMQCYQVVAKNSKANFRVLKTRSSMDDSCCQAIDQDVDIAVEFAKQLTRFRLLINEDTGDQRLAIGLSHAQYDGFCTDYILSGLYNLCTSKEGGGQTKPPPSYSRFIQHTQQITHNPSTPSFWAQLLQGSTMTTIVPPSNTNDPPPPNLSVHRLRFSLDKRPNGMSFATVLKTAWSLVLSRISSSNDVVFGSLVSGRSAPFTGATDVVGPCLNLLPVRTVIDPLMTFTDLMKRVHEQQVAMIPYEATPLEHITKQTAWPRSTRFGSVVLHQNIPATSISQDSDGSSDDERLKWNYAGAAGYGDVMFDFTPCWITTLPDGNEGMKCWLTYHESEIPTLAAEAIMDFLLEIIETIARDPGRKVGSLGESVGFDMVLPAPRSDPSQRAEEEEPMRAPSLSATVETRMRQGEGPVTGLSLPIVDGIRFQLEELWATALRHSPPNPLSPSDSVFFLGGDSLSAAHLSTLCTQQNLQLSIQDIYDYPTLQAQYEVLASPKRKVGGKEKERVALVFTSAAEIGP
ncbi:MAG: hypothetical protein Q9222_005873 [Ikaeria aurantiellina]